MGRPKKPPEPAGLMETEELIELLRDVARRKTVLPPELTDYYQRLRTVDRYLHHHMNEDVVVGMICTEFDLTPAEAMRDIRQVQDLFGALETHPRQYYAKLMLDKLGSSMAMAMQDRKFSDVARISKELREWLDFKDLANEAEREQLNAEVPRTIMFNPELLGVQRDPNVLERVREIIEAKTGKPFQMPFFPDADAQLQPDGESE